MQRTVAFDDHRPRSRAVAEGEEQPSSVVTDTALQSAVDDPSLHLHPEPVHREAELRREVLCCDGGFVAFDLYNPREGGMDISLAGTVRPDMGRQAAGVSPSAERGRMSGT